mmetsp:Transcript_37843/g.95060  ORF Transcript_37843/g.95060 Transcript_37843/m.95060 type:complete len:254 (+) Transcript_37843:529-1290(+)
MLSACRSWAHGTGARQGHLEMPYNLHRVAPGAAAPEPPRQSHRRRDATRLTTHTFEDHFGIPPIRLMERAQSPLGASYSTSSPPPGVALVPNWPCPIGPTCPPSECKETQAWRHKCIHAGLHIPTLQSTECHVDAMHEQRGPHSALGASAAKSIHSGGHHPGTTGVTPPPSPATSCTSPASARPTASSRIRPSALPSLSTALTVPTLRLPPLCIVTLSPAFTGLPAPPNSRSGMSRLRMTPWKCVRAVSSCPT